MEGSHDPGEAAESPPAVARNLANRWGGIRLELPAGQVLIYAGHLPAGLHVMVRGVIELRAEGATTGGVRLDAAGGVVVLPAPSELELPARATVAIVEDVEALFFPRHVVLETPPLHASLEALAHNE